MQRIFCFILFLCGWFILPVSGQEGISFSAQLYKNSSGIPASIKDKLLLKVDQIIARNGVGALSALYNAFIIAPELVIEENHVVESGLKPVHSIRGELTLFALNSIDNSNYGYVTVKVVGTGSSEEQAYRALIESIRVTDPVYTRFINNAKQKILDHYAQNCSTIMSKAEALIATRQYDEAYSYLSSIPETVPCYEEAVSALISISKMRSEKDCEPDLRRARILMMKGLYDEASKLLEAIDSDSECFGRAAVMIDSLESKFSLDSVATELSVPSL